LKTQQLQIKDPSALAKALRNLSAPETASLGLVFASPALLGDASVFRTIKDLCPHSLLIGCSTAGEISQQGIADDSLVLTLVNFETLNLCLATTDLADMADSAAAGHRLGAQLKSAGPSAVLVFAQGVAINGSALIDGLGAVLGDGVAITGGLAGDAGRFQRTLVLTPEGPSSTAIVALGLSGPALRFGHGCFGGWEPFGTLRQVTLAQGNVLYELDGKPALEVYRTYLGDYARDLPATALLFPFEMLDAARGTTGVIRTILGIDPERGSLTLAGDIDPAGYLQLMHASADRLISGAETAARAVRAMMTPHPPGGLALLVSCVGRKLAMGLRIEEEIEAVADILGPGTLVTGFYSYGEISPLVPAGSCRLHNQTMTITWIDEAT
jgi:hypothetical protein